MTTELGAPRLPGPGQPPLPPWPGAHRRLAGTSVFVRHAPALAPELPPAVYLHGLGGASTNWTDLMALLADLVEGYAPDLPGFGWSGPSATGRYPLDLHVQAGCELIAALGRGPVHLVGNSLGGAVATRLAARHPELVRSLTLVSPALPVYRPPKGMDPRAFVVAVPGAGRVLRRRLTGVSAEQQARAVLELCYHDPSRISPERGREAVAEVTRRGELGWNVDSFARSFRGLLGSYLQVGERNLWAEARRVRVPVLLIWGRSDRLVSVTVSDKARRAFPDARLTVFEDAGHVAMLEKPEESAAVVRAFLGAPGAD